MQFSRQQTMNELNLSAYWIIYIFYIFLKKRKTIWNKCLQKIWMNFLGNNYLFCYLTGSKWSTESAPFIWMIDCFQFFSVKNRMQLWKQISVNCICIPLNQLNNPECFWMCSFFSFLAGTFAVLQMGCILMIQHNLFFGFLCTPLDICRPLSFCKQCVYMKSTDILFPVCSPASIYNRGGKISPRATWALWPVVINIHVLYSP